MKNVKRLTAVLLLLSMLLLTSCGGQAYLTDNDTVSEQAMTRGTQGVQVIGEIPEFSDEPYVVIDNNRPSFTEEEITTESYEEYSDLDSLGRCGTASACVGQDIMPTEKRGSIGMVKPSGWQLKKYDIVDGKYLYNRCHLIGYQLTGENANTKNLITGTRYLNVVGMLPFEDLIADYVKTTGNHVMYRVTPIFAGDNLVASGVHMEGLSVEDGGEGVCFNIYAYNNQPGIEIDYATGNSSEIATGNGESNAGSADEVEQTYIINSKSGKFHKSTCSGAESMKAQNRVSYTGLRSELIDAGYEPCSQCNP